MRSVIDLTDCVLMVPSMEPVDPVSFRQTVTPAAVKAGKPFPGGRTLVWATLQALKPSGKRIHS